MIRLSYFNRTRTSQLFDRLIALRKQTASGLRTLLTPLLQRKSLVLLVFISGLLYSALSILRHLHFQSGGFDVGIFDQAVWHYSKFQAPLTTIRNNLTTENLLGDHFHPILALLSPLYWLLSGAATLLVAQAALFSLSLIPVFLFAEKRLGRMAAWLLTISYMIYWGVQNALDFEFHEVAFAFPLIAFAIYFIETGKRKSYFICAVLLLLTKEDLSWLVVSFGIYLILKRRFKDGLISAILGIGWFVTAIKFLIPYFAGRPYSYWNYTDFGADATSTLKTIVTKPWLIFQVLVSPKIKLQTLWYIFSPFLFLSLLSPLFILTIPLLAERFLSATPNYWSLDYHYTATIAPIIVMASIDGLSRVLKFFRDERRARLCLRVVSVVILAINLWLLPSFPLWLLAHRSYWRLSAVERTSRRAFALIPPESSVVTENFIAAHLSERNYIYLIGSPNVTPDAEYIIACRQINPYPFSSFQEIEDYLKRQSAKGYRTIFDEHEWIVLKRPSAPVGAISGVALLTEEDSSRAVALDSVTLTKGPFPIIETDGLARGQPTRILLLLTGDVLKAGADPSTVTAQAVDAQQRVYPLTVEAVERLPNYDWLTQVNVVLSGELANAGSVWISISVHGVESNRALLEIKSPAR